MGEGYHPGIDYTPIYNEEDSSKYRSIFGCFFLEIRIRKVCYCLCYICYELVQDVSKVRTPESSQKNSSLSQDKPKGGIDFDTKYPKYSIYHIEDDPNWKDFYLC
jgi:hypothetical protein